MRASKPNSSRDSVAILAQPLERWIATNSKIHFRAADEVVKITGGHVVTLHGVNKGRKDLLGARHGGRWRNYGSVSIENLFLTGDGLIKSRAPTSEAALF